MNTSTCPVYKHIFGPVPSRRLGLSLGVDLMRRKTCTLDCVYCECGKTADLTVRTDAYVPLKAVTDELDSVLSGNPDLDYITFSGSGEPTLHSGIGDIIHYIKSRYPMYKVAVLTNGTLLNLAGVRRRLLEADLVIASLDAASESAFRLINRPHPDLDFPDMIEGLVQFRNEYVNQYWIEIFIVPGINDSGQELDAVGYVLKRIRPDRVQLNSLDRPGTEKWVESLEPEKLADIAAYLGNAETVNTGGSAFSSKTRLRDSGRLILETIRRRPCTAEDLGRVLGILAPDVQRHLDDLTREKVITRKPMPRGMFYMLRE